MSDLAAGLLLLSNMKTPVMLTRSRKRPSSTRPPLVGRLHEMAVARPVPASAWWRHSRVAGGALIPSPQMTVLGRPGSGKGALTKRLAADAMRSWPVVVIDPHDGHEVLLDELAGCEPLDVLKHVERVIDPLSFEHARSGPPRVTAGEW